MFIFLILLPDTFGDLNLKDFLDQSTRKSMTKFQRRLVFIQFAHCVQFVQSEHFDFVRVTQVLISNAMRKRDFLINVNNKLI